MDWTLLALLAALLVTFLAWSRARRQSAEANEASEAAVRRKTYTLEPQETAVGRGFVVIAPDGSRLEPEGLSWAEHGLETVPVVGLDEHMDARHSRDFAAGQTVELIVDEPPTIDVWNSKMTMRAGRVPTATARDLSQRLDAGEVGECIVLWEELAADPTNGRTGFLLLLFHRDIGLER